MFCLLARHATKQPTHTGTPGKQASTSFYAILEPDNMNCCIAGKAAHSGQISLNKLRSWRCRT
jgi:hypothetical protein